MTTSAAAASLIASPFPGKRLYSIKELSAWGQKLQAGDMVLIIDKRKLTQAQALNDLLAQGINPTDAQVEVHRLCAWTDFGVQQIVGTAQVNTWMQGLQMADGTTFSARWMCRVQESRKTPYSAKAQMVPLDYDYETIAQLTELTAFVKKHVGAAGKGRRVDARTFDVMREALEIIERLS